MKKKLVCFLLLILSFSLTACSVNPPEKVLEIQLYCETMMDAIVTGNVDRGLGAMNPGTQMSKFAPNFTNLQTFLTDVTEFKLEPKEWLFKTVNGIEHYNATFTMTTNAGTYYVSGYMQDGYDRLTSFFVTSDRIGGVDYTGTLTTLDGANAVQWGILALSALTLAFILYCLVDCCKHRVKNKALCILFILAGMLTLTIKGGNIHINLSLLSLTYSHLRLYSDGDYVLQLVAPIGSILYLALRSQITLPRSSDPFDDL